MKKILKYQIRDLTISYSVFAGVMLLLTICCATISFIYDDVNISLNGTGITSAIFCLVVGIAMYKEHCQMAIINSVSRRDFFRSTACVVIIISFLCSVLDFVILIISLLSGLITADTAILSPCNIIQSIYPGALGNNPPVLTAANFLLALLINVFLFVIGILIAGIYCRIPKKFRTFYCIALPVFGFGGSPFLLIAALCFPGFMDWLMEFFLNIMGISSNNPFLGMLTLTVVSLAISCICYRLLRKTEIA